MEVPDDPKAVVIENTFLPNCRNEKFSIEILAHTVNTGITSYKRIPEPLQSAVLAYIHENMDKNIGKRTPEPLPDSIKSSRQFY